MANGFQDSIAISAQSGMVVISLGGSNLEIGFDPSSAREIADAITQAADSAVDQMVEEISE